MWEPDQYELLDFGEGRKLERFGSFVLDRPAPVARGARRQPKRWSAADARFQGHALGRPADWQQLRSFDEPWVLRWRDVHFELACNPYGHIGVFPEQAVNWEWLTHQVQQRERPCRVLNLFAYTGGATLAAASAGAEVTHVDASASIVKKARRNAALSSLEDRPVRWIVDDAVRFAQREIRRGRSYHGVILDPPAYGHGGGRRSWRLERDLPQLLGLCLELLHNTAGFLLLSCHVRDWGPAALRRYLRETAEFSWKGRVEYERLELVTRDGRALPSGVVARLSS